MTTQEAPTTTNTLPTTSTGKSNDDPLLMSKKISLDVDDMLRLSDVADYVDFSDEEEKAKKRASQSRPDITGFTHVSWLEKQGRLVYFRSAKIAKCA